MLKFLKNIFTRKNQKHKEHSPSSHTKTSKSSRSSSLARSSPKSILKKSASTRKKSLSFAPVIKSVRLYAPDEPDNNSLQSTPKCHPPSRPKKFPCKQQNTIFDDVEEFNQYARDVSDKIVSQRRQGLPSRSEHYSNMKRTLKSTGSYKRKIPAEYRFYDDKTGSIIDLRMFTPQDEWSD
jgi:hypothetical protein